MKKSIYLLVAFVVLIASCKKPCKDVVCFNGGECLDGACLCPQGYSGESCEILINPCLGVACLNGGICINGDCDCPPGYIGENCETPINLCAGVSCNNGGYCIAGTCICPTGYTGINCETQLVPAKVRIKSIRVDGFPAATPSGDGWDNFSSFPDIYVSINAGATANTNNFITGYKEECIPGNSYTYTSNLPYQINTLNTTYTFGLWDYDSTSGDEFMGGFYINLQQYSQGLPNSIRLWSANSDVDMRIYVDWLY